MFGCTNERKVIGRGRWVLILFLRTTCRAVAKCQVSASLQLYFNRQLFDHRVHGTGCGGSRDAGVRFDYEGQSMYIN
jgi:hypothetical protein